MIYFKLFSFQKNMIFFEIVTMDFKWFLPHASNHLFSELFTKSIEVRVVLTEEPVRNVLHRWKSCDDIRWLNTTPFVISMSYA